MGPNKATSVLTGTGAVCRVRIRTVEVTVAGADAGSRRAGAAVGGAGEAGPLSLLRLVTPRGTGCREKTMDMLFRSVRIWPSPSTGLGPSNS